MREIQLSTTAVSCFKMCPMRYFYRYILRLLPELESESQRFGTNWHKIMEILGSSVEPGGELPLSKVANHLNETYGQIPGGVDPTDWMTEKVKLLYSAYAYVQYYKDHPQTVLACELPFHLPFVHGGRKIRGVSLIGKIDKLLLDTTGLPKILILDHKATTRSITEDADFWKKFAMDIQTRFYPYGLREMARQGQFDMAGCDLGVEIDAFHKPGISPKKITQGESKQFVKDGLYCGQKFNVAIAEIHDDTPDSKAKFTCCVNNDWTEVEPGAKEGTFAIRETPEMYGARLLQEIMSKPGYYFERRPIPRLDIELDAFHIELLGIVTAIRAFDRLNLWYRNELACEATFKCEYCSLCYNNVNPEKETTLPGFIRRPVK